MSKDDVYKKGLKILLEKTNFSDFGEKYEGKVRDNYVRNGERLIITTDRLSAFDKNVTTIPFKSQILNASSNWWFEQTKNLVPNHLISVPDPAAVLAKNCEPLKCEFIVRSYVTGTTSTSLWTHYQKGERIFCGHKLPDNLKKNQKLDNPILTPSTKAPKGESDISVSREELISMGNITEKDFDEAAEYALTLFEFGVKEAAKKGLILVDTKYEFGKDDKGNIVVMDEIHTPEGSRYWYKNSYENFLKTGEGPKSFDKEFIRLWLKSQNYNGFGIPPIVPDDIKIEASKRYAEAFEKTTDLKIEYDLNNPVERLNKNLKNL
jgi:phosphoribosylaminoimidazole-succinocarboxamide synthase